jgi:diguanylate cyclase (GGDEF)-like protein
MLTPRHFFFYGLSCLVVLGSYYANEHYHIGTTLSQIFFNVQYSFRNKRSIGILMFMVLICFIATGFARHFTGRVLMVLGTGNFTLTPQMLSAINGWYLQFIAGMIAACFLITVVILYLYNTTEIAIQNSHQDALTGILNKDALEKRISELLQTDGLQGKGTFIMLDVDNFKEVNDRYGHPVGDQVLIQVAENLRLSTRSNDVIGRMGGDEFGFYLAGQCNLVRLERIARALIDNLRDIELPDGKRLTCSIGITCYHGQKTFDDFYREADKALYLAKNSGRNRYSFYHFVDEEENLFHS